MNVIKLIKPSEKYLNSYLEACIESKDENIDSLSYHAPGKFDEWKNSIFQKYENQSKGINLPKGYVPATTYWLVDHKNFIGCGSIRHTLTDSLKRFGGHIGYFIRKKYWSKGYGTLQLKLLLKKATDLGILKVLLTCNVENIASARIMEKNGGKRIDEISVQVDGRTKSIYKYEIKL